MFVFDKLQLIKIIIRIIKKVEPAARYLLIVWIITIIVVSSLPTLPTPKIHSGEYIIRLDYLFHFCEYGLLAFLAYLSFAGKEFRISLKKFLIITLLLIIFAVLDEFHQKLIPGRSFNLKDIASNICGIVAGLIFCLLIFRKTANEIKSL
jgi:VanZ family protein